MRIRVLGLALALAGLLAWWIADGTGGERASRVSSPARRGAVRDAADIPDSAVERTDDTDTVAHAWVGRVQVLGPSGPIPGVTLTDPKGLLKFAAPTDAKGWAAWHAQKEPPERYGFEDSLLQVMHKLHRPVTTVRFESLIPLTVEFVEVGTGAVIEEGGARLPPYVGGTIHGSTPRELLVSPARRAAECEVHIDLEPPPGRTSITGLQTSAKAYVSARAIRARLRVAVWPEIDLKLVVSRPEGGPAVGVRLDGVVRGDQSIHFGAEPSDASGEIRVRGVPFVGPGQLAVYFASAKPIVFEVPRRQLVVPIVFNGGDAEPEKTIDWEEWEDAPRAFGLSGGSAAELEVHLVAPDGDPVGDVPVLLLNREFTGERRSDRENGRAFFGSLYGGTVTVAALDPVLAFAKRKVTVKLGERTRIQIGPAVGRTITFVCSHRKRSVLAPGTRLSVTSPSVGYTPMPFDNGVQDLTAVAGPGGRLVWYRFPEHATKVRAHYNSEDARVAIEPGVAAETVPIVTR